MRRVLTAGVVLLFVISGVQAGNPAFEEGDTIIPAFITRDGKPYMSFGVMGGATQPRTSTKALQNLAKTAMQVVFEEMLFCLAHLSCLVTIVLL